MAKQFDVSAFVLGRRVVTQGAWMQLKQPAWDSMPVLNVRSLTRRNLTAFRKVYDSVATQELLPLAQLLDDSTRRKIDDAISEVLGVPDLLFVRQLLVREPGLTALGISHRPTADEENDEPGSLLFP
jgi:hypothetical protein